MARASKKAESAASLKLKTCTRKIRVAGEHVSCAQQFLGDDWNCPNWDIHLGVLKTGYCSNGWHEGTKSKTWKGDPAPNCRFTETCPCTCHDGLDKLFAMTGKDRIFVDSSGYSPPPSEFVMPERFEDRPLSIVGEHVIPTVVESPAPDLVPPSLTRSYAPTASGRTPKGQLESWVNRECGVWLIDAPGELCTPQYLANEIARVEGIPAPSVGAIGAIFDRWVSLGFAVCLRKPVRFERYTDEGRELGLERMKARKKDSERRARADNNRGSLRR